MGTVVNTRINEWLQIAASIGVIVGLILVAYEIRETNRLAISETTRELSLAFIDAFISDMHTDVYSAYVKSFENPGELTSEEILKLSAWLTAQMTLYNTWYWMHGLDSARFDGTDDFVSSIDQYFGSAYGRAWYSHNRYWIAPAFVEIIDREIGKRPLLTVPPDVAAIRPQL